MQTEIMILAAGAMLLFVHIIIPSTLKTRQYGIDWNTGPRDETMPPLNPVIARLARAQANFQETFPIAIVALIGVVVTGRESDLSAIGGWIWLAARLLYLPLYAFGVEKIRSIVFLVSLVGLGLVLYALVFG
ncbi:hypothetical protein HLH34_11655 [Gluconacetobacter azotocaptans]|uniref:MAPEG family protein n=2 Tax=Gluconacetobacter azotocaptans TaxID=142834 RepID=A0A7W4PEI6_9PROT|nr:hypothetical protein [Gluconacetobacter azotocaptans]GBQ30020.1 hypothetical protein AA13594_1573 [Gluconacetobacter azotocaptans DSM 13594]